MHNYKTGEMRTHYGRYVNLIEPTEDMIQLADIAFSLARTNRFNGNCTDPDGTPLTVAEHSINVMNHVYAALTTDTSEETEAFANAGQRQAVLLAALLHDAHEAYTGDITRPMASAIDTDRLPAIKQGLQVVIHRKFGLPAVLSPEERQIIKEMDAKALLMERWQYGVAGYPALDYDEATALFLTYAHLLDVRRNGLIEPLAPRLYHTKHRNGDG